MSSSSPSSPAKKKARTKGSDVPQGSPTQNEELMLGAEEDSDNTNDPEKLRALLRQANQKIAEAKKEAQDKIAEAKKEAQDKIAEADKKIAEAKKEAAEAQSTVKKYSLRTLVDLKKPLPLKKHMEMESSNKSKSHHNAATKRTDENLHLASLEEESESTYARKITKEDWKKPSFLLMDYDGKSERTYQTEADVSHLVSSALNDAIRLASPIVDKELSVHYERSLFSERPDLLVVVDDNTCAPLVAVEVKKPLENELKEKDPIWGQLFDYAIAMHAFGHVCPVVVFTTFEKSYMLRLDRKDLLQDVMSNMGKIFGEAFGHQDKVAQIGPQKPKQSLSPPDLKDDMFEESQQGNGFTADSNKRKLVGTSAFKSHNLVQLLYTAILCAAAANPSTGKKHSIQKLVNKGTFQGYVLEMTAIGYRWGNLKAVVGSPIQVTRENLRPIKAPSGWYYVIDIIGTGNTSKVYHALNNEGVECVIKMYTKRYDEKKKKQLSQGNFGKKAKKATENEMDNFKILYPEMNVYQETIFKHWCVVLPFFQPIKSEDRHKYLGDVEKELDRFQKLNFVYENDDVRWRHVGLYNNKIVLFDLADLRKNVKDSCSILNDHKKTLADRMGVPKDRL